MSSNTERKNDRTIILGVYIHCEGCANDVLKCLCGFEGVEGIEIDAENHKVAVKGKKVDPLKVTERLRKKTGKHVELISPIQPKKQDQPKPKPKVIEAVLKMNMHCEGCAKDIKRCIHRMEGVQTVEVEMTKNLVTVKGSMEPQKLVEFVGKRGGWNVTIVKMQDVVNNVAAKEKIMKDEICDNVMKEVVRDQMKEEIKAMKEVIRDQIKEEIRVMKDVISKQMKDENRDKVMKDVLRDKVMKDVIQDNVVQVDSKNRKDDEICCYVYPPAPLYAPQLFSDENPNSCVIM